MQQFNWNVQWEFYKDYLLEVGYVGSKGTKLLQVITLNQPVYNLLGGPCHQTLRAYTHMRAVASPHDARPVPIQFVAEVVVKLTTWLPVTTAASP